MKRLLTTIILLLLAVAGHATCSTCACTSCPITSWSQYQVYAIDDNNTPCNKNDDKLPVKIKVNHQSNAKYSFDGKFSVKIGSGSYVDYNYATGSYTYVMLYLPYGTPANVTVMVRDDDYSNCTKTDNLSCVANNGVNCPSSCYCSSCPITSWSQHAIGTPNTNGTPCNKLDDKLPVTIKVNHLACAENSGDGKFSVKVGTGSYVAYDYSSGTSTYVTLNLPYGTQGNVQVSVKDFDFSNCTETDNLNCVSFYGVCDNIPPTVVTCPPSPPLVAQTGSCGSCGPTTCGTEVFYCAPTATDNCGPVTTTSNYDPGDLFPVGTTTVTYTFKDQCNNTTNYSFTVTVLDNTKPVANCKAPFTVTIPSSGTITIQPSQVDNGSTDNCGIVSRQVIPNTFTCADANTTKTVKLIVTDAAGNKDTCQTSVTINGQSCQTPCNTNCSISVTPCNSTYTGGVATDLYLGYGPQSLTLSASSTGSNCTYIWTGLNNTPTSALSSTTSANPVFTPNCPGQYKYRVTIKNCNNCTAQTICDVTICVKDVRYDDNCGYDKVLLCYSPGNCAPYSIAVHPLLAYFFMEYCSDFTLGYCGQTCQPFNSQYKTIAGGGDEQNPAGQEAVDKLVEQFGIGKLMADQAFDMVLFPNPTKTDFRIRIQSVIGEKAEVRVFDVTGRIVEQASIKTNVDEVVGRNLAPGAYIIEVAHGGHVKKTRAVKQ